ncbi:MAG: DUF2263 domain-containing protein [Actinomycetales bacterium]|nr:DUF2263 domain-containing protein [Actinomycetales bacterium]
MFPEDFAGFGAYATPEFVRRRQVLSQTVTTLSGRLQEHRERALENHARWRKEPVGSTGPKVQVIAGDWGEVTGHLTAASGEVFAVLNMANAYVPGGGYVEGCPAQEENMFRRTDCHFSVHDQEMDPRTQRYLPAVSAKINAELGRVLLDTDCPRVCVRGGEDRGSEDLGYRWLSPQEWFCFYELRAAAVDLRDGSSFDPAEASKRIRAQLETLIDGNVRHAVLSAFGCGAFMNPADQVAAIYRGEVQRRLEHFDCLAFAIFYPGYGPDNYTPFAQAFSGL